MNKKAVLGTFILIASVTAALFALNHRSGNSATNTGTRGTPGITRVESVTLAPATTQQVIRAIGTVRAHESITLRPENDGRITHIAFDSGQFVRKGATLVVLDGALLEAELAAARAAADYAEAQYRRNEILLKNGIVTQRTFEETRSQRDMARAQMTLAQTRLNQATLRAPFDGYLGLRRVSVGDYVQKGDAIGTLDQLDPIRIEWTIAEKHLPMLKKGMMVELEDFNLSATVTAISPRIDPATRLGQAEARITNPDQKLKPGQFVPVRIIVEKRENALMIPEHALVLQGNQHFVWVIDDQNKARKQTVSIGTRIGQKIEILGGISSGARIVTAGQQKLRPEQVTEAILPINIEKTPDTEELQ